MMWRGGGGCMSVVTGIIYHCLNLTPGPVPDLPHHMFKKGQSPSLLGKGWLYLHEEDLLEKGRAVI